MINLQIMTVKNLKTHITDFASDKSLVDISQRSEEGKEEASAAVPTLCINGWKIPRFQPLCSLVNNMLLTCFRKGATRCPPNRRQARLEWLTGLIVRSTSAHSVRHKWKFACTSVLLCTIGLWISFTSFLSTSRRIRTSTCPPAELQLASCIL